jgi:dihydroorotate dehydrogenase (NAD+) catalytic subunit
MPNKACLVQQPARFATQVGPLQLASPILNASGTFCPETFARMMPLADCLGAIVTKTVTPQGQPGNPQQRTVELPGIGMLNSIGLQGKGIGHLIHDDLPTLADHGIPVILSLSASSVEAFTSALTGAFAHPNGGLIDAVELNLSCPNVKAGGVHFGSDVAWVGPVVAAAKAVCPVPVLVKLTPNVTDMRPIAEAALCGGADGLVAINTVIGAHIDVRRRKPSLHRVSGGYSGPGIKPVAIHHIIQLRRAFPTAAIVGVGGIVGPEDVLEFLMAGASAVQVGTGCFADPLVFSRLLPQLAQWCDEQGVATLAEIIGCAVDGLA